MIDLLAALALLAAANGVAEDPAPLKSSELLALRDFETLLKHPRLDKTSGQIPIDFFGQPGLAEPIVVDGAVVGVELLLDPHVLLEQALGDEKNVPIGVVVETAARAFERRERAIVDDEVVHRFFDARAQAIVFEDSGLGKRGARLARRVVVQRLEPIPSTKLALPALPEAFAFGLSEAELDAIGASERDLAGVSVRVLESAVGLPGPKAAWLVRVGDPSGRATGVSASWRRGSIGDACALVRALQNGMKALKPPLSTCDLATFEQTAEWRAPSGAAVELTRSAQKLPGTEVTIFEVQLAVALEAYGADDAAGWARVAADLSR